MTTHDKNTDELLASLETNASTGLTQDQDGIKIVSALDYLLDDV